MLRLLKKLARSLLLRPLEQTTDVGPIMRIGSASYPFDHFTAPRAAARELVREDIKRAADRGDWDWPE